MENPIKHGVRVYGTNAATTWYVKVSSRDADWKLNDSTTWQVRRSEFDRMMLDEALKRGAKILRGTAIKALQGEDGALVGIRIRHPNGEEEDISTKVVLDCSGQSTFLANQKVTGPKYMGSYDKQVAFFTHVAARSAGAGHQGRRPRTIRSSFTIRNFTGLGSSRSTRKWSAWEW